MGSDVRLPPICFSLSRFCSPEKAGGFRISKFMDRTTQESFRPLIRERLTELQRSLAQIGGTEAVAPDKAIGRLSRLDSMQMQQMALAGKRRLEAECRRLEEALERIGRGVTADAQSVAEKSLRSGSSISWTPSAAFPAWINSQAARGDNTGTRTLACIRDVPMSNQIVWSGRRSRSNTMVPAKLRSG